MVVANQIVCGLLPLTYAFTQPEDEGSYPRVAPVGSRGLGDFGYCPRSQSKEVKWGTELFLSVQRHCRLPEW